MISREEILNLASLAKLYVSEEELDSVTQDMAKIIGFADEISKASVENSDFDDINGLENVFREDEVKDSFDRDLILKNANGGKDGFFYGRIYLDFASHKIWKTKLALFIACMICLLKKKYRVKK